MLEAFKLPSFVTTYWKVTASPEYTCVTGAETLNDTPPTKVGVEVAVEVAV
jgi:hypothetical protein